MSPLPIISNVYRIAVDFQPLSGIQPVCVHHVRTTTADVAEIGAAWWAAAPDGLYGPMLAGHEPQSISIIPLDGATATRVVARPGGANDLCLGTGQSMPQVAALVSMRTVVRGPRGRGRQYVGPLVEQAQDQGVMESTTRANLETAWVNFLSELALGDPPLTLGVASYTHEEFQPLESITVDTITATQRRRQDQLR